MAAYVKRNLTASCENLTTIMISPSKQLAPTCHSTLSVDSLCPSTVSQRDNSNNGTMTSEYLLLTKSIQNK